MCWKAHFTAVTSLWACKLSGALWWRGRKRNLRELALFYCVSWIWISASKKSIWNADWRRWRCFSMFVYILAHYFLLFADSRKSDSSVDRKPQGNWRSVEFKFQPRSASACSPTFSQSTTRVSGELALRLLYYCPFSDTHHRCCG